MQKLHLGTSFSVEIREQFKALMTAFRNANCEYLVNILRGNKQGRFVTLEKGEEGLGKPTTEAQVSFRFSTVSYTIILGFVQSFVLNLQHRSMRSLSPLLNATPSTPFLERFVTLSFMGKELAAQFRGFEV